MKKILKIIVLFLLLTVNAYASKNFYLICKIKATYTNIKGPLATLIVKGPIINVNYISIVKSKSKVLIKIREHFPGILWAQDKPTRLFPTFPIDEMKIDSKVSDSELSKKHFFYTVTDKNGGDIYRKDFQIYKQDKKWNVKGRDFFNGGITSMYMDYKFEGPCDEYSEKEFLYFSKKGIK